MATTYTPAPDLGTKCPDFTLPGVDGKTYSLKDFTNGKPVVFVFICNHCPYVRAIENRLIELGHDLANLSVNMIAICSNDSSEHAEDNFENLKKRSEEMKYSFKYLHDKSQTVAVAFGAVCTPDFFVYDGDLKAAYRGRLDDSWKKPEAVTRRELFEAVQMLLKDEKPIEKQIPSMGCNIKWLGQ